MRFHPAHNPAPVRPDWDRAERLVAQLEYERDVRDREHQLEPMTVIDWSPAQHVRRSS